MLRNSLHVQCLQQEDAGQIPAGLQQGTWWSQFPPHISSIAMEPNIVQKVLLQQCSHLWRCKEVSASLHPSITIRMWRTQPGLLWIILKGRSVSLSSSPHCHQQQLEQNYILLAKQFDKIAALQKSVPWDCWRRHVQKGTKLTGNVEILNP